MADPARVASPARSSELLGFAPGARVPVVNRDHFGMYDAVNSALAEAIEDGSVSSCSPDAGLAPTRPE